MAVPSLPARVLTAIVTHPTLALPPAPLVGDANLFSTIGKQAFSFLLTEVYSRATPPLSGVELTVGIRHFISLADHFVELILQTRVLNGLEDDNLVEAIVKKYRLRDYVVGFDKLTAPNPAVRLLKVLFRLRTYITSGDSPYLVFLGRCCVQRTRIRCAH